MTPARTATVIRIMGHKKKHTRVHIYDVLLKPITLIMQMDMTAIPIPPYICHLNDRMVNVCYSTRLETPHSGKLKKKYCPSLNKKIEPAKL